MIFYAIMYLMELHSKRIGNLGELKVASELEKVNNLESYLDVNRILRDYTRNSLPGQAEGNDIVQTTTVEIPVDENQSSR